MVLISHGILPYVSEQVLLAEQPVPLQFAHQHLPIAGREVPSPSHRLRITGCCSHDGDVVRHENCPPSSQASLTYPAGSQA